MQQHQPPNGMCLIMKGTVRIVMEGDGVSRDYDIAELGSFDVFGHIDLLFQREDRTSLRAIIDFLHTHDRAGPGVVDRTSPPPKGDDPAQSSKLGLSGDTAVRLVHEETPLDHSKIDFNHRALSAGTFASYSLTSLCELLIVPERDFFRYLAPHAMQELRRRLGVVSGSGIFRSMSFYERLRLARMGTIKVYKPGEAVLQQGEKPSYLCFIMRGTCVAFKRANRGEILFRLLAEAKEKAEHFDLKYAYHHNLRNSLSKAAIKPNARHAALTGTLSSSVTNFTDHSHVTESESQRLELDLEIARLEGQIMKLKSTETKNIFDETEPPPSIFEVRVVPHSILIAIDV